MTMEYVPTSQPQSEREALFPTSREATPVVKPSTHTGELAAFFDRPDLAEAKDDTSEHDELTESSFHGELRMLDNWLGFKVKNAVAVELAGADFKTHTQLLNDTNFIDRIAGVLRATMREEQDRHFQAAQQLENVTIPSAEITPTFEDISRTRPYSSKDVEPLTERSADHWEMFRLLEKAEGHSQEAFSHLAAEYVESKYSIAAKEIVTSLEQTVQLHKQRKEAAEQKVLQLQREMAALSGELQDRDMKLLDSEMTQHLAHAARPLIQIHENK